MASKSKAKSSKAKALKALREASVAPGRGKSKMTPKEIKKTFGEFVHSIHPKNAAKPKPAAKPPAKSGFGSIKGKPEDALPSGWLGGATTSDERAQPRRLASEIKIGKRFRTDFSHVPELALSFNECGMIQPIGIDRDNALIFGECRLKAWEHENCKWRGTPLPVVVLPIADIVAGEWAENDPRLRKPFSPTETVAIKRALDGRFKEEARARQGKKGDGTVHRSADAAAAFTGRGRVTVDKAEQVVEAAERDPERFGKLVEDMDRTKRVDGPFKRLQNMLRGDALRNAPPGLPMNGPYHTLSIDFPWEADLDGHRDTASRGYYPYATMTLDAICEYAAREIMPIMQPDCAVWLWIPNFHLVRGCHIRVLAALGVEGSTMLTWVKPEIGQGQRLRGATEHAILAVRGKVPVLGTEQRTWFDAPAGKAHSAKPQEFFHIVEIVTPAPRYAFLFAGGSVPENWDGHGDRIGVVAEGQGSDELSPEHEQSSPPQGDYPGDDEHESELTELQALTMIEAGQLIEQIGPAMIASLKVQKFARGSVKLKLTKAGMVRLEKLRQEEYSKSDPAPPPGRDAVDQVEENNLPQLEFVDATSPEGMLRVLESIESGAISFDFNPNYWAMAPLISGKQKLKLTKAGRAKLADLRFEFGVINAPPEASVVDCRVCSEGTGLCAECIAAGDHVVTTGLDLAAEPAQFIADCSCGFSCRADDTEGGYDGDVYPTPPAVASAIKAHLQNVVTEAKAAAVSTDIGDIPASLRRGADGLAAFQRGRSEAAE